ncbi:MAG: type II toxin-antitoxin system HicA family toxin [Mailhella sp.]|nr:type II toxin-antitoxin system HicA family toxin [Mailhella sp.]
MKPSELEKILKQHGFSVEHRSRHDIWTHPDGRRTTVFRHTKEIPTGTLHAILKQTQIPL